MTTALPQDSLRVLVADDDRDTVFSLLMLLRQWGYVGVAAYDGPGALDVAATNPHDVVVLDIGLPGMDGYEVARRLRQLPGMAEALLVAITGYAHAADVQRCKEAGIDCHFPKPVDPAEIQKVLAKAQSLGQYQRQLTC
jgi:two-component system CheB/CheR fusion protein